jgi:hypothetical protein
MWSKGSGSGERNFVGRKPSKFGNDQWFFKTHTLLLLFAFAKADVASVFLLPSTYERLLIGAF